MSEGSDEAGKGRSMEMPTPEMFRHVEEWAKGVLSEITEPTPVQALYTLSFGMFVLIQQKKQPECTAQEIEEMGKMFLQHHTLSASFPFSNQEIARYIVVEKAKAGARGQFAKEGSSRSSKKRSRER